MINSKTAFSNLVNNIDAVNDIKRQLSSNNIKFIIFFASPKYDFKLISEEMKNQFSSAEIIGCTTAGEISSKGFTENSLVAMSITSDDFTVETTVIHNVHSIPMLYRDEVEKTFNKTGFDTKDLNIHKKGFGILLIDGLQNAEEKVLSVVNSIIKNPDFQIIGGSAADGLNFGKTYVSHNGKVYNDSAIITFVKTKHKICLYKENIFKSTEKNMIVTKANIRERRVYEIDNKPAAKAYAEALGIHKSQLTSHFSSNPLGRKIGAKVWIASPFEVMEDDSIKFYSQLFTGTCVYLMEPEDPVKIIQETVKAVRNKIPNIKATFAVNCILRIIQFKTQNKTKILGEEMSKLGNIIGFSSYGEQLCKMHLNQTLVLLVIGE